MSDFTRSPSGGQSETQELERIPDAEIIEEGPSWEEAVSEWAEGSRLELAGQLRQARAAAAVSSHYGTDAMGHFASEVGASKSKVYSYAKVWMVYGHIFEDGSEISSRLETLGITHLIKGLAAPDPLTAVEEAHDEGLSTREMEERVRELEEPENTVKVQETRACEACGGTGEVPVD